jgi:hypothetical protein
MSFVAAAIVGGTALVGGVVSASASSSAANKAAKVSQDTTNQNNALARDIYAQNTQTLAPFVQQGGAATAYINQLLGIQSAPAATQPAGGGTVTAAPGGSLPGGFTNPGGGVPNSGRAISVSDGFGGAVSQLVGGALREDIADRGYGILNTPSGGGMGVGGGLAPGSTGATFAQGGGTGGTATAAPALAPGSAGNAFDAYRNSTGYQFRQNEGMRAVTANKALSGLLNSGSAVKSAMRFGDGIAAQEFDNYYNRLAGQQGVGLSAASAQAGVANNYSSQVQGNNSINATNAGNAAIARGNAVSNAVNGVTSSLGYVLGNRG